MTEVTVHRSRFAVEVSAVTDIQASPAAVWAALTTFPDYAEWNPFIRRIEGRLTDGGRLTVELHPGKSSTTLHPRIVAIIEERSFTWLGHVGVTGILDGRHTFTVDTTSTGTRFIQHERLSGVLVPLFRKMLTVDTPAAFRAMNDALTDRVER